MTKLILLPGFDGSGFYFKPLLPYLLDRQAQVISYTAQPNHSYTELTRYVQTQLPKKEPHVLVAESFSGPVAYRIAAQSPPNLQAVIFVATFLRNPRPWLMPIRHVVPWQWITKVSLQESIVRRTLLMNPRDDREYQVIQQMIQDAGSGMVSQRLQTIAMLPTPTQHLQQPCLYLQATADLLVPPVVMEDFGRLCDSLQVRRIRGGHFLLQNHPQACVQIIDEFLTYTIESNNR